MARGQIEESLRTKMATIKERMVQLQDAPKGASVTSEATERELELEAQLVEARSIIQEQVHFFFICDLDILPRYLFPYTVMILFIQILLQESIMCKHLPKSEQRKVFYLKNYT